MQELRVSKAIVAPMAKPKPDRSLVTKSYTGLQVQKDRLERINRTYFGLFRSPGVRPCKLELRLAHVLVSGMAALSFAVGAKEEEATLNLFCSSLRKQGPHGSTTQFPATLHTCRIPFKDILIGLLGSPTGTESHAHCSPKVCGTAPSRGSYRGLNNYYGHVEVYLRYLIQQLY